MNPRILESITCKAARPLLSEYLDDALPSRASARVAAHLDACAACAAELRALRCIAELAAFAPAPHVSSALKYRILNSVARQEVAHRNSPMRKVARTLKSRAEVMVGIAFGIVAALVWNHWSRVSEVQAPGSLVPPAAALMTHDTPSHTNESRMAQAHMTPRRTSIGQRGGVSSSIRDTLPILWATMKDAAAEDKRAVPTTAGSLSTAESTPDETQPRPEPVSDDAPMIVAEMPQSMMMTAAMEESASPDNREATREMGPSDSTTMSDSPGDVIAATNS